MTVGVTKKLMKQPQMLKVLSWSLTGAPSGRTRPTRSESLTGCVPVPWCLNHPSDIWHTVVPTLTVDGRLVSKFGRCCSEHAHNSCLTFNNCQCTIACCTLVGVFVLHCSALFHDFIPADHIASQVSSSAAAATSRITSFQACHHSPWCCSYFSDATSVLMQEAPVEPAMPAGTSKPSIDQQGNEGLNDEQLQVQNADPARQQSQAVLESTGLPLSPDTMQRAFQVERCMHTEMWCKLSGLLRSCRHAKCPLRPECCLLWERCAAGFAG